MRIATAEAAAALLRPFLEGAEEERVAVLHLEPDQRVIGVTCEQPGRGEDGGLPVAAILGRALKLGTAAMVVGRRSPSASRDPAPADGPATRRLAEAAAAIDVRLVDYLVFTSEGCRSFAALGLL